MNKSILIGMTAISLALTAPIIVNPMNVEAKVVSVETAAKEIYKAETKAYNKKKNVTVTVEVACKSKKAIGKTTNKICKALDKVELNECVSFGQDKEYPKFHATIRPYSSYERTFEDNLSKDVCTYNNKKLKIKMTVKGNNKYFRKLYKEHYYFNKNVATLKKLTKGMTQKQKAWASAVWIDKRMYYKLNTTPSSYDIYKGVAHGMCETLSDAWAKYALAIGVEHPGIVVAKDHAWCCVKIDGEIYYFDVQEYAADRDREYGEALEIFASGDEERINHLKMLYDADIEDGTFVGRADEVSREDYGLLPSKQGKIYFSGNGKPSTWEHRWY